MIKIILRIEGICLFLTALFVYAQTEESWLLFVLLLFAPDISMLGYLINNTLGAFLYNLVHNYILGLVIIFLGYFSNNILWTQIGIILLAHVILDRMCGFGLKKSTGFHDTHLGKIGKKKM